MPGGSVQAHCQNRGLSGSKLPLSETARRGPHRHLRPAHLSNQRAHEWAASVQSWGVRFVPDVTQIIMMRCKRRPFWAVIAIGLARSPWYRTRMPPAAVVRARSSSCGLRTCIPRGQLNKHAAFQAERSAHRPAGAALLLQSGARTWARTYRRNTTGSRPFLRAHSSLVSVISLCPLEVARKRRIRAIRPTQRRLP